ncbi:galactose-3-O-sulfotransferase 2 [Genypterus blacodes]|uniref:galactose-3-O-sulfotransferase 2 n=1 Tax=Genypterus blacodes TaxID=154954 RepID=UPI003F76D9AD
MWIVMVRALREMLTPWRWSRGRDHARVMSVRRGLCSQTRSLWILLMLLALVCVAIQMLGGVHNARNDKLTDFPQLRFNVEDQDVKFLNNRRTADLTDKSINMLKSSQTMTRKDSPREKLLPGDKPTEAGQPSLEIHDLKPRPIPSGEQHADTPSTSTSSTAQPHTVHTDTGARGTCQPKSHIMFLKTHKTASSTILNILYRYGESRNLTFALPVNGEKQLFYPHFFASHFVEGVGSRSVKEFHIMCNHMRFRKHEVAKVMPEDTFYFSILRNPVEMMESIFVYYHSTIQAFRPLHSLDEFLDKGLQVYNSSVRNNHYAHNILAFDFGFDNNVATDTAYLEARVDLAIRFTERDFHLILISDYFDESMILLKHALCWSLDDVVSFTLNKRSAQSRHPPLPSTADKIKRWNALDYRLYQHFNTTFWHKVDHLVGQERMRREVSELRELRSRLAQTCLTDGGAVEPSKVKDAKLMPFQFGAAQIEGYNLNPGLDKQTKEKCQKLITPELQYTDILYSKQFPMLRAKQQQQHRRTERRKNQQTSRSGLE